MKFSEREGYKSIKEMQIESIDSDLKNSLWNVIYDELITNEYRLKLCLLIWTDFMKYTKDSFIYKPNTNVLPELKWDELEEVIMKIREIFYGFEWFQIYDLLEFIGDFFKKIFIGEIPFIENCNRLLERENSAYRFVNNLIVPITSEIEIKEIELAIKSPLETVNIQLKNALENFSKRPNPDLRNSIKDSINALESLCGAITKEKKPTLGNCLNNLDTKIGIHSKFKEALKNLYHYASDDQGIRHGLKLIPTLELEDAKFMLITCSSFVNYIISKCNRAKIIL